MSQILLDSSVFRGNFFLRRNDAHLLWDELERHGNLRARLS